MTKKIIATVTALTLVFGAAGAVIPMTDVFGTAITANALERKRGKCGDGLDWILDDGMVMINGSGKMTSAGWRNYTNAVESIDIHGAENIMNYAFYECTNLSDITVDSTVTAIGDSAFYGCSSLEGLEVSVSVKTIGPSAFANCKALKKVTLYKKDVEIGYKAFGFYKENSEYVKIKDFTIYGLKDSTAEKYAKENGLNFVAVDDHGGNKITVGDANGDGDINVTDIAVVASHIKGIKALTGDGLKAADVNADGDINVTDIAMIASHIKGIKALK